MPGVRGGHHRLLLTKLLPPRLREDFVWRPRLLQLLEQGSERKLTIVSTPPGYGKSTLAGQWLASSKRSATWLSLDENDNYPISFFSYVVAAVQRIDNELCIATARMLAKQQAIPVREIVDSLINELAAVTNPFTLVWDDFHVVSSPEILQGVSELVAHMPPTIRLLLTTRNDPRLPLLRMRARGELAELRAADLSFTPEEARELLCDRAGLDLSSSEIAMLQHWAEGWPVGLILAGQTLEGRPEAQRRQLIDQFPGISRFVEDYLWSEAIEQQPPDRRSFLLQTSILNQFNAEACEAVTGSSHAAELLRDLEVDNLFLIALEGRQKWFRYHHLFADVLRERLNVETAEEDVLELHRRAARWHLAAGFTEETARHAIAGKDWELATSILIPMCSELYQHERIVRLQAWLKQLPVEVLEDHPQLAYWLAWALVRTGRVGEALLPFEIAERAWSSEGNEEGLGQALQVRILEDLISTNIQQGIVRCNRALSLLREEDVGDRARVLVMRGLLFSMGGDLPNAQEALIQGRALAQQSGTRSLRLIESNGFGGVLMTRGKLHEPAALFQRVIATGDEWNDIAVQYAHWLLASIHLEWNLLESARDLLIRAGELADRMAAPLHQVRIHLVLAELAWAREDPETAFSEIEQAIDFGVMVGAHHDVRTARALLAQFWMSQNQLSLARGWASESGLAPDEIPEFPRRDEYLTLLSLMALEGQQVVVVHLLERAQQQATQNGYIHELLRLLLIRSIAEHELGNAGASASAMDRALQIGAPEGFVRSFFNEGARLIRPLELAVMRKGEHHHYAQTLLEGLSRGSKLEPSGQSPAPSLLSRRESEVLHLVASGHSNRDIADTLFIAEQTVKKHLSNLFLKLEVSSRTQAVARGRQLDLLDP
jgi:LuxR family maltose regulon positive regulatory protein